MAQIGVDTTSVYAYNGGVGRPTVRIASNTSYNHGLFLLDLAGIPRGCGTWPTFGLVSTNWPSGGEIGITLKLSDVPAVPRG